MPSLSEILSNKAKQSLLNALPASTSDVKAQETLTRLNKQLTPPRPLKSKKQ